MIGIVVGADGSESGAQAVVWAAREADLRDLPMTAVLAWDTFNQHHTVRSKEFDPGYGEPDALAALNVYVEQAVGATRAARVERRAVLGSTAQALLDASTDASVLVLGSRGRGGFGRLLLGSVSQQCLHYAECPVAIVRPGSAAVGADGAERIVVGIDGSETARRALAWAAEEARVRRAVLQVVHAWHMPSVGAYPYYVGPDSDPVAFEDVARSTLADALHSVGSIGLAHPVEQILSGGGAASVILEAAKDADLVVVGSSGHGGFTGMLLGSVSQHVAHHATCPVVIVPLKA